MDGSRNQFLARAGLAGDENAGVGRSDLGNARKHRLQGRRSSHDLLEHRYPSDFFAQRDVLVLESLFSLLALLDIGRCGIPTCDASVFISYRVPAEEKPAIRPVFSQKTCFVFVREAT